MSTVFRIPSRLQKNFKVLILNLSWLTSIFRQSLPTFFHKKQLTSVFKIYQKIGIMLITSQKTLSVSCLPQPCLNHWSYTIINSISSMENGVAMGSPLQLTLANVFLCYHEKMWLQNCPSEFKFVIYRRYVDDTFLLFH